MRGPAAGRIQASKGLRVKARERSRDGCGETELEQNCRRNEGKQQRCSTSGWQHFHLSNQSTHPPHSHQLFCQAGCLSAALCTRAIFTHFLHPAKPYFFNTHILYAHSHRHTHIHTLPVSHCLRVSLRRMSITAQGKEVPIRRQECDASGGPMTTDNTLARAAVWVRVRVRPTVVRV